MVSLHRTHPFGDLITRYRARRHGLSQVKLADLSGLDPTVLSHMCNGRRLEGQHARERVLRVIDGLCRADALKSVEEANNLLKAARLADLHSADPTEADLLATLQTQRTPIPINSTQQIPPSHSATLARHQTGADRQPARGSVSPEAGVPGGDLPPSQGVAGPGMAAIRGYFPQWIDGQPFTVGGPVIYPRSFFGRTKELGRLFGLLRGPQLQNGAVIGPRYMGKTSLLRYLASITQADPNSLRPGQKHDWLAHPDRYMWVYVDLGDSRLNAPKLLLSYILQQFGLPPQKKVTLDQFGQMVRESVRLPAVILLDNIDVAAAHYGRLKYEFWAGLSSVALNDAGGRLGFIVAAQESFAQMANHPVIGSSFFTSIGISIELGPLAEGEALDLIEASPIPFPLRDVAWILVHSNLEPMPLQLMCRERLQSLESGDGSDSWRDQALRQISAWTK